MINTANLIGILTLTFIATSLLLFIVYNQKRPKDLCDCELCQDGRFFFLFLVTIFAIFIMVVCLISLIVLVLK